MATDTTTLANRSTDYQGTTILSAATTDLNTASGDFVTVSGTVTITSLGTCSAGREVTIRFSGALVLTHNATSLILPGAGNITTVANDCGIFRSLGSGNWICVSYSPSTASGITSSSVTVFTNKSIDLGTNTVTGTTAQFNTALSDGDFATLAGTEALANKTLTTPLVKEFTEVVTSTNVIAASESGSTFFLSSATEFVSTLPVVAAGLNFRFIVGAAPSGASYTIVTNASANIIKGKQFSADGAAGDTGTSDDTITFVDGQSVAGDMIEIHSDGTSWFAYGFSAVAAGITFTTAS